MMGRRVSLREFQESLAERLQQAHRSEPTQGLLGIASGKDRWLVSLAESGEVVPLTNLAPVPLTKPWFAGVANVRGALYSVVDFSAFRGGAPTTQSANARLLLIGAQNGVHCALLVDRTLGLKNPEQLQFEPETTDQAAPVWGAERCTDADGVQWHLLRTADLLEDPAFLDVGVVPHAA